MAELNKVQTTFLDELVESEEGATIFLMSGMRLVGHVTAYDQFSISLEDVEGNKQVIFKHAISTIIQGMQKPPPKPKPTKNTLSLSKDK